MHAGSCGFRPALCAFFHGAEKYATFTHRGYTAWGLLWMWSGLPASGSSKARVAYSGALNLT